MKAADRLLQDLRILAARPWLRPGWRVLDIGCADGALFRRLTWITSGLGLDPEIDGTSMRGIELRRGSFPEDVATQSHSFDAITALAVIEHVPQAGQEAFAVACHRLLRPGGRLIITVPAPVVDEILHVLMWLRIVDGMETHQHWGLQPSDLTPVFEAAGFDLERHRRFECGANHVFVFRRS